MPASWWTLNGFTTNLLLYLNCFWLESIYIFFIKIQYVFQCLFNNPVVDLSGYMFVIDLSMVTFAERPSVCSAMFAFDLTSKIHKYTPTRYVTPFSPWHFPCNSFIFLGKGSTSRLVENLNQGSQTESRQKPKDAKMSRLPPTTMKCPLLSAIT